VHMLHVPSDHIWRPDIVLYNKWVFLYPPTENQMHLLSSCLSFWMSAHSEVLLLFSSLLINFTVVYTYITNNTDDLLSTKEECLNQSIWLILDHQHWSHPFNTYAKYDIQRNEAEVRTNKYITAKILREMFIFVK
jgi:hypothetical protein